MPGLIKHAELSSDYLKKKMFKSDCLTQNTIWTCCGVHENVYEILRIQTVQFRILRNFESLLFIIHISIEKNALLSENSIHIA